MNSPKALPLVDSNILISFFTQDAYTTKAKSVLKLTPCYLNHFVLTETANFLQNKYSPSKALGVVWLIVGSLRTFYFLECDRVLLKKAKDIMAKYQDNALAFTDCILLAQSEYYDVPILTRDRKMQLYPNAHVVNPFDG